jgi:phosphocarrier protein
MLKINGKVLAPNGLTARLSTQLVAEANKYNSSLILTVDGESADLKSIMNVMALVIPNGLEYEISLNGNDEEIAYEHFIKLLKEIELL